MRFDIIAVDGSNALHRAHHTAKALTTEIGGKEVSIGAAYQFLRIVLNTYEKHGAPNCRLVIAWEGGPSLIRHGMWSGYKNRERNPEIEFQRELLQERILPEFGWAQARAKGWEADDVMATIAFLSESIGKKVGVLSGDHDMHQVVTDAVHVINPTMRTDLDDGLTWRVRDVRRLWWSDPLSVPGIKALCGDPGDGIPGAPGIGDKWAKGLVSKYGSLAAVLDAAERSPETFGSPVIGTSPKKAAIVVENKEKLLLFRELCTVNRSAQIEWFRREKGGEIKEILSQLRFASLMLPETMDTIRKMGT